MGDPTQFGPYNVISTVTGPAAGRMSGEHLRLTIALALALSVASVVNRRGPEGPSGLATPWRWVAAQVLMTVVLWLGVFVPLATVDVPQDIDLETLRAPQLILTPLLLLVTAALWALLAWGGDPRGRRALGLVARRPWAEIGIGLVAGLGAWAVVLGFMLVLGLVLVVLGGGELPGGGAPSPLVVWMAGLGAFWRLGVSLAAGLSEELFFRGLLQRRLGILLSTLLFVLGHVVYGAPLMLVGLALLSLIYAVLVRWRGNIWAAVVAHAVFDAVQLLVVIPAALAALEAAGGAGASAAGLAAAFWYAYH